MTIARNINTSWRVFATGFVFVMFGLGALVISLTLFPVLRLTTVDRDVARARIQRGMRRVFQFFIALMKSLGIMTWEVHGLERLRQPGRLIVPNHPTLIDVVLVISFIPEIDCIVKRGLWRNPFLRWPVAWASYIPNSEGEALIEDCAASLRRGHSLLVFPEGTRTVPGQPLRLQRGAAHIALTADAEILPVTISCDPPTLYKGNPWHRAPARRFHMRVVAGEPIAASSFRREGETHARAARRLTQWLLAYYTTQLGMPMRNAPSETGDAALASPAHALH